MSIRFQADADLDGRIIRGLRRSALEIDIRTAADAGLVGLKDPNCYAIEELILIWSACRFHLETGASRLG